MYYGKLKLADIANGPGIRISLFVSGCKNHCKNCFQKETWDFCYGKKYTNETENIILKELSKSYYDGITILGGEPFELENQPTVLSLIQNIKNKFPNKNIWMYTGYLYDTDLNNSGKRYIESITDKILDNIDVLVDGRFDETKRNTPVGCPDPTLLYKGSSNQRIIDMKKTRKQNKIILSKYNDNIPD